MCRILLDISNVYAYQLMFIKWLSLVGMTSIYLWTLAFREDMYMFTWMAPLAFWKKAIFCGASLPPPQKYTSLDLFVTTGLAVDEDSRTFRVAELRLQTLFSNSSLLWWKSGDWSTTAAVGRSELSLFKREYTICFMTSEYLYKSKHNKVNWGWTFGEELFTLG